MTTPRDPDALLAAYLAVGMEVLPDRVVNSVLDEVHRTHQHRVLWPARRTRPMSRTTSRRRRSSPRSPSLVRSW